MNFPKLKSIDDFTNTLNKVTDLFKVIAVAWEQCPGVRDSEEYQIKKASSILRIFADPTTNDLYNIALGALDNWETLNDEAEAGKAELN